MGQGKSPAGKVASITIHLGDGQKMKYRTNARGVVSNMNLTPADEWSGMTMKQVVREAKKSGFKVDTYDEKQLADYDNRKKKAKNDLQRELEGRGNGQTDRESRRKRRGTNYRGGALFS